MPSLLRKVEVEVRQGREAAVLREMQERILGPRETERMISDFTGREMNNGKRRAAKRRYARGFAAGNEERSLTVPFHGEGFEQGHRAGRDERARRTAERAETERRHRVALDGFHKGILTRDELNANFGTPKRD